MRNLRSELCSYRKEHADDLVQVVFFILLKVQWVNLHGLLPLKRGWHLSHRATKMTPALEPNVLPDVC